MGVPCARNASRASAASSLGACGGRGALLRVPCHVAVAYHIDVGVEEAQERQQPVSWVHAPRNVPCKCFEQRLDG